MINCLLDFQSQYLKVRSILMKWSMKNPKMMDSVYRLLSNVPNFFVLFVELKREVQLWCRLKECIDEFLDSSRFLI